MIFQSSFFSFSFLRSSSLLCTNAKTKDLTFFSDKLLFISRLSLSLSVCIFFLRHRRHLEKSEKTATTAFANPIEKENVLLLLLVLLLLSFFLSAGRTSRRSVTRDDIRRFLRLVLLCSSRQ